MSKYEDDAMELIETVVKNSHHNAEKPFRRGAMLKMIDDKSAETGLLNIHNCSEGLAPVSLQEALSCANCSRFDHIELECHVMAIQGQNMFRQGPSGGLTQQGQPNFLGTYSNYYNTPIFNNSSKNTGLRRNNEQTYPPS